MKNIQAYGTWIVTTEGDCEGRTTRNLGTHTGYLDDIAFALADQAYYGLRFSQVDPLQLANVPPHAASVLVSLDIDTGTWDMSSAKRIDYFQKLLRGRDTVVQEGAYFATVNLISGKSPEAQEAARNKVLATNAQKKLSAEELAALLKSHGVKS
jgi:hypothetical protein